MHPDPDRKSELHATQQNAKQTLPRLTAEHGNSTLFIHGFFLHFFDLSSFYPATEYLSSAMGFLFFFPLRKSPLCNSSSRCTSIVVVVVVSALHTPHLHGPSQYQPVSRWLEASRRILYSTTYRTDAVLQHTSFMMRSFARFAVSSEVLHGFRRW